MRVNYAILLALTLMSASAQNYEARALAISRDIQARHIPFGTILNPMYVSALSNELQTYTRCGDSAIWTGHWLAAEAFRYAVTKNPEALRAAQLAFRGIRSLVDVTGEHRLLARCILDSQSRFATGPRREERHHGEYSGTFEGRSYLWIGNTSRDQYMGVFFGLSVAFERLPELRADISTVATKLIDRLVERNWSVVMPEGNVSTVFWHRPDQMLAVLQTGRQVNPERFATLYTETRRNLAGLELIMRVETLDSHNSYFKFNLDGIGWYTLLRLEEPSSAVRGPWLEAYQIFRRAVAGHGNAFFNVIDRALTGADRSRDSETTDLLTQWLVRPRRDDWVDLRSKYRACGEDRACEPIPVPERIRTDFLWQRSPFLLYGGGEGRIEGPGIDFILPYWMGRYYGINAELVALSAASGGSLLAPGSIAALYAGDFAEGSSVHVDTVPARVLFAGRSQINFLIPDATPTGLRQIRVMRPDRTESHSTRIEVAPTAPALFSADTSGKGVAAALATQSGRLLPVFDCARPAVCTPQPLEPRDGSPVYVSLFGTGIRRGTHVTASFDTESVPVLYAGAQPEFPGLDQINIRLDAGLQTRGERDLHITVDGREANPVQILVR